MNVVRGERHGKAKLTADDVLAIRAHYAGGMRLAELHRRYPFVTVGAIRSAITGRTWAHLEGADPTATPRLQHASSKLPGVDWHPRAGKWRARIRIDGHDCHLGLFNTEDEAAGAILEARVQQ